MPSLLLIPGLPLAAFVVLILVGRRLGRLSAWLSIGALAASCALTVAIGGDILHGHRLHIQWPWLSAESSFWTIGLAVDGLTWLMLAVVTSIGTLIQLYSIGYMRDDPRFSRFFAYLSLFCASMLMLVMADHFVLLYAGWELVGLCSYLLISFWFEKPAAAAAGRKAFITTRIGDTGLLLGILLLAFTAGELHFDQLDAVHTNFLLQHNEFLLTVIGTLMFFGAVGKSAQFPLHVWLPDAMEGPTPVSALIHAATMVAAGVYLVARTFPLFTPQSLAAVLGIGLFTHLAAGTIALTQTDIKRILAYSTISQLGLMFTALGLGAMPLAMFHLTTHAWFKALLFLGAGSVIHATHQQDLSALGGLFRAMPVTAATFLIAALAMSGAFPLSGFWSKDAILLTAQHEQPWVFWALLGGAVMTTAYIFRLYLRCFHGGSCRLGTPPAVLVPDGTAASGRSLPSASPAPGGHAHESPLVMTGPLATLAIGAAAVGLLGSPMSQELFHLLGADEAHGLDLMMLAVSTVVVALGVWLAWTATASRRGPAFRKELEGGGIGVRQLASRFYRLAFNKYFVDEWYDRVIIQPFLRTTEWLSRFDLRVIDATVDRTGLTGWSMGQLKNWFDQHVVDGLVNGTAQAVQRLSLLGRRLQTGVVHHYLLVLTAAAVVLSACLRWF